MLKLIYSNLIQRPTRTLVSILAVSLGVVLVLVSVGLSHGQLSEHADRTMAIGGELMLQPTDGSLFFALNSGALPVRLGHLAEEVQGVEAVTPILTKFLGDKFHIIFGVDPESFLKVNRTLTLLRGRMFAEPFEAVIDTDYARSRGLDVGDTLDLLAHEFTISGVYREGTGSRVMIPLPTLQDLNGTPDRATVFFIRLSPGASVEEVEGRLKQRFEHYRIVRTSELRELVVETTPVFREFLTAVVLVSVAISFLIILLAMYGTITERTREIGVLKSLGASKAYIIRLIVKEALLICGLGVAVGFILTSLAIRLILMTFPSMPVLITPTWQLVAALMAIAGGTLGALYPAVKAAQLDPVKALGYE